MRVTRSFMLWLVVAFAAAGCAQQPVMRVQMTAAPQGIDNVIYGPAPAYGTAAAPAFGAATARGYFASYGPAYAMAAPTYTMAPAAPMMAPPAPAPTYNAAAPPLYASAAPPAYGNAPAPQLYASTAQPAYAMAPSPLYASTAAPDASGRGFTGGLAVGNGRVAAAQASYSPYPSYSGGYAPNLQYPYSLDSGDRLRIVVFGQEGLTNSYVLDAGGQIQMPLIGAVAARGLTTDQLTQRIGEMLRQGFIREPHVAVEIEGYRPFFILGEVTQPGQYPYVANMTVETAVAIAGGFGPRAQRKQITISRNFGGQVMRFEAPVSYPLRPGDTIQVQERWF